MALVGDLLTSSYQDPKWINIDIPMMHTNEFKANDKYDVSIFKDAFIVRYEETQKETRNHLVSQISELYEANKDNALKKIDKIVEQVEMAKVKQGIGTIDKHKDIDYRPSDASEGEEWPQSIAWLLSSRKVILLRLHCRRGPFDVTHCGSLLFKDMQSFLFSLRRLLLGKTTLRIL